MTITNDQVAQWAREASESTPSWFIGGPEWQMKLVTRAMAAQAEADAVLCDGMEQEGLMPPSKLAELIRANAPKQEEA